MRSFEQLNMAFTVLNIEESVIEGLFSLVSAVLHIGNLTFVGSDDGEAMHLSANDKQTTPKIAKLLGVCEVSLSQVDVSVLQADVSVLQADVSVLRSD